MHFPDATPEDADNEEWLKLFGIKKKVLNALTIKTVIMMPFGEFSEDFEKMELNLTDDPKGDKLELNYLYFDPEDLRSVETSL